MSGALSYGLALVIGLAFVATHFPWRVGLGLNAPDALLVGDVAANVVGQRYFVGDSWHWPLLVTKLLEAPHGVNVILTDSIPVAALAAKLISPLLPHPVTLVFAWLALCYVLQPVAAVYALRGTQERRILPAAAVAAFAICMPTFLYRAGHIALCSHFLLLVALGLYLRVQRDLRPRPVAMAGLLALCVMVQAYLLVMVSAILAATPLGLLARGERAWRGVALALGSGLLIAVFLALAIGYGGMSPGGGFGKASMNLLSPVFPAYSTLLDGIQPGRDAPIDATGFQFEGYQYLGLGLLLLIAAAVLLPPRPLLAALLRRHAGLVLVCIGLFAFAASNIVYIGYKPLLRIAHVPAVFHQLRASGRFFWPVSYVLLLGATTAILRGLPYRVAVIVLAAAVTLQVADTQGLRQSVSDHLRGTGPEVIDEARMHALLDRHRKLTIWPSMECGTDVASTPAFMATIVAASDRLVPINAMYVAREQPDADCDAGHVAGRTMDAGELRVFMPNSAVAALIMVPEGGRYCRALRNLAVCSRDEAALQGLALLTLPAIRTGAALGLDTDALRHLMAIGWAAPEPEGAWSLGGRAVIAGQLPPGPAGDLRITLTGKGLTDAADRMQRVTVAANGKVVAQWAVGSDRQADYSAIVPKETLADGKLVLTLEIGRPVRPIDLKINGDTRRVGFFLAAIRFDPVMAAGR
jgi:hypothetical protein